jgi:hypothetical protein
MQTSDPASDHDPSSSELAPVAREARLADMTN